MVSIVILTKNEEKDLPNCLSSLTWCDDIHVLDSGSTDKTIEIAENYGAKICSNPFESFGQQRNFALDNIPTKYTWVLFLDADEISTDAFYNAMNKAINTAEEDISGFYCCWKMIMEGKWLKYCDNYPKWQFRLVRKGWARFTDFGHGQKEHQVKGHLNYIKEPYLHNCFSKGWFAWIERHNRYSTQEAYVRLGAKPPFKNIFSKHGSSRNPVLRYWLCRLPGWPMLRFLHAYVVKFGFLEGKAGFIYCVNMAYYEFLIKIKMREIQRRR